MSPRLHACPCDIHVHVLGCTLCDTICIAVRASMNADMSNEGGDTCSNEMVDSVGDHSITWHFEASI